MRQIDIITLNQGMTNTYICHDNGEYIIIDIGESAPYVLENFADPGVFKLIVLTHGHYDHITTLSQLCASYKIPIAISALDAPLLTDPRKNLSHHFYRDVVAPPADILLNDGDELKFGHYTLRVIATPGHTDGSICLLGDGVLFSGDTIFRKAVGKFSYANRSTMIESLTRILDLPADTVVYAGHGEPTTIANERGIEKRL